MNISKKKESLLVFHGGPGLSEGYLDLSELSKNFNIVRAIYPKRTSLKEAGQASSSLNQFIEQTESYISSLNLGSTFPVLAHSWGNFVLLKIFEKNSSFTSGPIISVCPFPASWGQKLKMENKMNVLLSKRISSQDQNRIIELKSDGDGSSDRELISLISPLYVKNIKHAFKLRYDSYDRKLLDILWKEIENFDVTSTLKSLSNRISLILGEDDFIDKENASEFVAASQSILNIKGCGHSPFLEQRKIFVEYITQQLNRAHI